MNTQERNPKYLSNLNEYKNQLIENKKFISELDDEIIKNINIFLNQNNYKGSNFLTDYLDLLKNKTFINEDFTDIGFLRGQFVSTDQLFFNIDGESHESIIENYIMSMPNDIDEEDRSHLVDEFAKKSIFEVATYALVLSHSSFSHSSTDVLFLNLDYKPLTISPCNISDISNI